MILDQKQNAQLAMNVAKIGRVDFMNLRRQATINTAGNTIYLFALWGLTVITTRVLGYEDAGTLTLAIAIGNVIAMVQVFGVRGYQSSDMAFRVSSMNYLYTRFLTVFMGLVAGCLICLILGNPLQVSLSIILFMIMKTSETFSDVLFGNDQRVGHLEYAGYSMLARGLLLTALFFIGAKVFSNLNIALLIAAIGVLTLSLLVDLPLHKRTIRDKSSQNSGEIVFLLKQCFPLLIANLIPAVITAFPRVVLERCYGAETLGIYGNVSTPALLLTTIMPTILTALLPGYGKAVEEKNIRIIKNTWLQSILGTVMLTAICMIGVWLLGRPFLSFVYTERIAEYIDYLYLILVAMLLYAITMCNSTVLIALRKNWSITLTTTIALIICVSASVPLVSRFGIGGAVAVLVISYAVQVMVQVLWITKICRDGIYQ